MIFSGFSQQILTGSLMRLKETARQGQDKGTTTKDKTKEQEDKLPMITS